MTIAFVTHTVLASMPPFATKEREPQKPTPVPASPHAQTSAPAVTTVRTMAVMERQCFSIHHTGFGSQVSHPRVAGISPSATLIIPHERGGGRSAVAVRPGGEHAPQSPGGEEPPAPKPEALEAA